MTFKFNFGGDDSDDDDTDNAIPTTTAGSAEPSNTALPAALHTLDELLQSLPQNISYTLHPLYQGSNTYLPRRDLYDIRMQLMAADPLTSSTTETTLLSHPTSDIIQNLYEGGLKTWECSLDLTLHLTTFPSPPSTKTILELGCGPALPSLYLFSTLLQERRAAKLTLADYNPPVLSLLTLPNLFLVYVKMDHPELMSETSGDLDVTPDLISSFRKTLETLSIDITFISGAWGADMVSLLPVKEGYDLVLASETIYSPASLPAFTATLLGSLSKPTGKALVAAKKIYFGVGGGVEEFLRFLEGKEVIHWVVGEFGGGGGGVGRVVLEVRHIGEKEKR